MFVRRVPGKEESRLICNFNTFISLGGITTVEKGVNYGMET